ncbi:DUF2283 domain-containing protein [Kineococcus rhizosphaerae]|uniref:Uncharacterized protein DUF2283 n=1 Tax=Kineococcus rhizosphaerae TaxID=559628 RepID=A0A2T0R4W4_9ACTN|nr:DUF2283 domain-containing protein [Kineococcus rhizosphaerae]PRY15799.1 uncharacterized protein DUF2283 [Kineococcus rhizosphaerae]
MDGTWDAEVDAAYINLRGDCTDLAWEQVIVDTGSKEYEVILDFSAAGRLLGVEVLGATAALDPALIRTLRRIDRPEEAH